MTLETAYVGVGSNIDPGKNIIEALRLLVPEGLTRLSTVYRTEPVGAPGEPFFYNCVVEMRTSRPPVELKYSVLRPVEASLGRIRGENRCSSRQIDLDLVLYGSLETEIDGLILPDREIFTRAHLAIPLFELAPELVFPGGLSLESLASSLATSGMQRLEKYTERAKKVVFERSGPSDQFIFD